MATKLDRVMVYQRGSLREKSPYPEFFWSSFFDIRTKYGEILRRKMWTSKTPNTDSFHVLILNRATIRLLLLIREKEMPMPSSPKFYVTLYEINVSL